MRLVTCYSSARSRLRWNQARLSIHRLWITLWTNCEPEVDLRLTAPSFARWFQSDAIVRARFVSEFFEAEAGW